MFSEQYGRGEEKYLLVNETMVRQSRRRTSSGDVVCAEEEILWTRRAVECYMDF